MVEIALAQGSTKPRGFSVWSFHPLSSNLCSGADFAGPQLPTDTTALWNLLGSEAVSQGSWEGGGLEAGDWKLLPKQGRALPGLKRKGWEAVARLHSRMSELGGFLHLVRGKDHWSVWKVIYGRIERPWVLWKRGGSTIWFRRPKKVLQMYFKAYIRLIFLFQVVFSLATLDFLFWGLHWATEL